MTATPGHSKLDGAADEAIAAALELVLYAGDAVHAAVVARGHNVTVDTVRTVLHVLVDDAADLALIGALEAEEPQNLCQWRQRALKVGTRRLVWTDDGGVYLDPPDETIIGGAP